MTNQIEVRRPIPPAPIHPLAALATIVLDNFFGVFEVIDPLLMLVTSVIVGAAGAVTTTLVQHYLAKDEWGPSIAKGLVMGIVAGVPFQVVGTAVGVPLLAWAGLHQWVKMPLPAGQPAEQMKAVDEGEIVDGEVREITDGS
jgi:hypothetical protein